MLLDEVRNRFVFVNGSEVLALDILDQREFLDSAL